MNLPRSGVSLDAKSRPVFAGRICRMISLDVALIPHSSKDIHYMQTSYNGLPLPTGGEPIQYADGKFTIPDHPIIPFIEGDGTGRDIWRASQRVFDAAVEKAYGGKRSVKWFEVYAGEKAFREFKTWLPDETVNAARDLRVSIKGPADDSGGGRYPLAECGAAADSRSVLLRAAGEVLRGRAQPGEASGEARRGDLSREHRRRLCGHRISPGHSRGGEAHQAF